MAGIKIVNLPALGRNLASTDLFELSLAGGTGSRKITGQEIISAIPSGITIGTTAITSGTVGRVLFEGTGNVVQESANLFWDNTNGRLGIGTSTPSKTLSVIGSATSGFDAITFKGQYSETGYLSTSNGAVYFASGSSVTGSYIGLSNASVDINAGTTAIKFFVGSQRMTIGNTGNVLINTTTDAGFKLDVNGTARVSDNLLLTNGIIATSTATTRLQGSLNYFTHNRIGSSGALGFQIAQTGTLSSFWRWNDGTDNVEIGNARNAPLCLFTNNTEKMRIVGNGNVLINTTTDNGYLLDVNGTARISGTTTLNSPLTVAISNLPVINLLDTLTNHTWQFRSNGGSLWFIANGANNVQFRTNGNVLIGTTTDAGYKLDVNGTARVTGNLAFTTGNIYITTSPTGGGINSAVNTFFNNGATWIDDTSVRALDITYANGIKIANTTRYPLSLGTSAKAVASAQLEMVSTTQGFLPPRMTQAQRNAIASPAIGLEIYQTDATEGKYIYKSSGWTYIG
jgi:hypothetical protein